MADEVNLAFADVNQRDAVMLLIVKRARIGEWPSVHRRIAF
jgi:hypothetical protein